MIDYFSLLQQPRRPWLDAQKLKERYLQLTISAHPDRQPPKAGQRSAPLDFTNINEALRVLLDPKLRLQHLLKLEGMPTVDVVPETLSDVFLETGTLIQEIDRLLAKVTTTHLSKALLQPEILEKRRVLDDLICKLEQLQNNAMHELQALDQLWMSTHRIEHKLSDLASRFAYLSRWIAQLEERKFQLSIL
jgi:DnaJ-domain-containing protein 1